MENLINYLNNIEILNHKEVFTFKESFELKFIKKGTAITKANSTANYIHFLDSGIVKGYSINSNNYTVNHLIESLNFFVDFESFKNRTIATDIFEAITDCTLYKLSLQNFQTLYNSTNSFEKIINTITNNALQCKMERIKDFQTLTAKDRYLKVLKTSPNIINSVSVNDLSSYLGITPPSLSRIRKEVF